MRARVIAAGLAGCALLFAGCGGTESWEAHVGSAPVRTADVEAAQLISATPDLLAEAGSVRLDATFTLAVDGDRSSFTMDGLLDVANGTAVFNADYSGLTGMPGTIEMRLVDDTMYMSVGGLRELGAGFLLPDGVNWVAIDLAEITEGLGSAVAPGANPGMFGGLVDALRGAGEVTEVGPETIGDTETTHYHATLDLEKALAELPAAQRAAAESALELLGADPTVDAWLDADGRLRRMAFAMEMPGIGNGTAVEMTMDFTDYGTEVAVEAPPASETTDLGDVFGDTLTPGTDPPPVAD